MGWKLKTYGYMILFSVPHSKIEPEAVEKYMAINMLIWCKKDFNVLNTVLAEHGKSADSIVIFPFKAHGYSIKTKDHPLRPEKPPLSEGFLVYVTYYRRKIGPWDEDVGPDQKGLDHISILKFAPLADNPDINAVVKKYDEISDQTIVISAEIQDQFIWSPGSESLERRDILAAQK